ncbi:type I-B CRISPR-associated protein Cas5b [Petrimonas mucosa]|jgi:CRISPR-associated protein Cas5h|uniref:Crispr-associated protein Cas5, hmari subtype n=1 Tax=Petrimonas mucosa TaxID=1642646 RepID=A0A1G4G594_9BACT|nr:type I-B CRISPR-associated protein Cas5b [Petrimonas mucosa]SCM56327.1 Crispr-associated protein Cas5, hmari subtype {ECO:0000313/EMBL:EAY30148,1} [Petrimonas mucosa]
MNYKELLIFDITGEYGHFRKYNTTTSPLTYSVPTRTAIAGMLGAILGMERETRDGRYAEDIVPVQEFFSKEKCGVAVQVISPVKKENIGFNLINTKTSFYDLTRAGHTQTEFELVKDPHYRIYLAMEDQSKFEELSERIENKRHHFTPYLGLAQFTAQVDFVQRATGHMVTSNGNMVEIITAVNLSKVVGNPPVEFQRELFYSANNMPIAMNRERQVLEYSEVLIEKSGKPLHVRVSEYLTVEGIGNILFL